MTVNRKTIWQLSWPLILANFTIPLVSLVDTIIMGHMPDSIFIASIAIGGIVFNFIYAGLNFLRMSTTGLVAQISGKDDVNESLFYLIRPLILSLILGITIIFSKEILFKISLYFFEPSDKLVPFYKDYLFTRIYGIIPGLMNMVFLGWFLGNQKSKFVLTQVIIINILNIIASFYFAIILELNIHGIALGSVTGQLGGLIISILLLLNYTKFKKNIFLNYQKIFHFYSFSNLFKLGSDLFIRTIFLIATQAYLIRASSKIGVNELATIEIIIVIFGISSYVLDSFAHAAETLVGHNIGAKNKYEVIKSIRYSFEIAILFSLIISLFFLIFKSYVIASITNIPILRYLTSEIWYLVILTPLISVFAFQFDGIFIGATLAKEMRNTMILSSFIFFIIVKYLEYNFLTIENLYFAFLLFLFLRGFFLSLFLRKIFQKIEV